MKATAIEEIRWARECLMEIAKIGPGGHDYNYMEAACLADCRFSLINSALVDGMAQGIGMDLENSELFINAALEEAGFPLLGEAEEDGTW